MRGPLVRRALCRAGAPARRMVDLLRSSIAVIFGTGGLEQPLEQILVWVWVGAPFWIAPGCPFVQGASQLAGVVDRLVLAPRSCRVLAGLRRTP